MSQSFYQPLRPGMFCKTSFEANLAIALKTKEYTNFILTYICLHAHPENNEAKFEDSLIRKISTLTGWNERTIKRSLKTLVDLKIIKNLTPRKPHYLVNAEYMNKQTYLPYGFQQGLKICQSDVVELIMRGRPIFQQSESEKLMDIIDQRNIELAQKDLEIEALEESKEELIMWYDEKVERLEEKMDSVIALLEKNLTPEQKKELMPKLHLVKDTP